MPFSRWKGLKIFTLSYEAFVVAADKLGGEGGAGVLWVNTLLLEDYVHKGEEKVGFVSICFPDEFSPAGDE